MTPLRISATLLEKFRLYMEGDWMPEEDLIATIKGEFTQNRKMAIGKAYHALLERPQRALSGMYEHDGFSFEDEAIDGMLNLIEPGVFEVKHTKLTLIAQPFVCEVRLVTKADHLAGGTLTEFKTTLDPSITVDNYMESYQWRVMAVIFGPQLITYRVALLQEDEDHFDWYGLRGEIQSLNVYPYPDVAADVRELTRRFVMYLHDRNLDGYLREKLPATAGVRA